VKKQNEVSGPYATATLADDHGDAKDSLLPERIRGFCCMSKEGNEPSEEALLRGLKQFVADSNLSFYQIASLIGTSGAILSMWLAGTAKPDTLQLAAIDRFLKG